MQATHTRGASKRVKGGNTAVKCGQGTIAISQLADTGSCDTLIILVEVAWPGCLVSANMLNIEPD